MKSDSGVAFIYCLILTAFYIIGFQYEALYSHEKSTFSPIYPIMCTLPFIFLCVNRLKTVPKKFSLVVGKVMKIFFLSFLFFVVLNSILSLIVLQPFEISIPAALSESSFIIYMAEMLGALTLISAIITIIIKMLMKAPMAEQQQIEDHLIEDE